MRDDRNSNLVIPRLVPLEMNESVDKPQGNMNWDAEEKNFNSNYELMTHCRIKD